MAAYGIVSELGYSVTLEEEKRMRQRILVVLTVILLALTLLGISSSARAESKEETLERLERRIEEQQAEIDAQKKAIEKLKQQEETGSEKPAPEASPPDEAPMPQPISDQKPRAKPPAKPPEPKKVVETGQDKIKLLFYGQVNRAILYSNDGDKGYWYFVDNDNSSTRIGFLGSANPIKDFNIGTRIEVEFQTNDSNKVSQRNQNNVGDNNFRRRHFDIFVRSKRFGKLSLGYGSTASDNTAEVDLSGTAVVGYSSVGDMAGGQFFFDNDTNSLSNTTINDVFANFDGIGRDDRLRYDTPNFYGFMISGSVVSGDAADVALRYSAKLGDFKLAAAAAYADPAGTSDTDDNLFTGSVSVLHSSGFNLTFAAAAQELKVSGRDDQTFYYGKLGYQRKFFSIGTTAMSVDYSRNDNLDQNDDKAISAGFQFVQNIDSWGTEYYLGYRYHSLDRKGADFKDINAMMTGLRVKF